jgi:hypothetical protein
MSDAINQHKRMAMGQSVTGMKKGGSVQPPVNFGPAKQESPVPPKGGFQQAPLTKVKRANGVKGV